MAPFRPPDTIITGFKEKIESLTVHGDRLYLGTATGNLHIYSIDGSPTEEDGIATLVETRKSLTRKAIEQVDFIKDINSLVILSEASVALYPLPKFAPSTPLIQAKTALSFALNTTVLYVLPDGTVHDPQGDASVRSKGVATFVTHLAVGCRRKIVVYSWRDGEPQDVKEAPLPHSPRTIVFINHQVVCLAYSPDYALFSLETMSPTELPLPTITASVSVPGIGNVGMGALSGLGGYMSLGLGGKAKPAAVNIDDSEALLAKDNSGIFIGTDGKPSRPAPITWPAPPEELAFVKPYIISVMPPGSVPQSSPAETAAGHISLIPSTVLQIRSSFSLLPVQTLPFPFTPTSVPVTPAHHTIRLLTPSPAAKSPLFLVTTPTDRTAVAAEGSAVWMLRMKPWGEQIDELVEEGSYVDALALLNSIDPAVLPDKDDRQARIRALNAVSQFQAKHYDVAIDTFIDLDINPAKVVALYPETVAGRLSVPQDGWIPLFGGPPPKERPIEIAREPPHEGAPTDATTAAAAVGHPDKATPPVSNFRGRLRNTLETIVASAPKDDDSVSLSGKPKEKPLDEFRRSVETLFRYLTDRRPKVGGALGALHITPAQSHQFPFLSSTSIDDLFALPNVPLSALAPEQLVRYAQIVDTALFKAYLLTRPSLLASLCRLDNWCEVSEVEEVLLEKEKFAELIFLYHGKKMHDKSLSLLRKQSVRTSDMEEKLMPSINYLQQLGPDHTEQVFDSARWVFRQDPEMALQIFTSEQAELPRQSVADYLEGIDPNVCAKYIEFLIVDRHEQSFVFHDRLAGLYLSMVKAAKKSVDESTRDSLYAKLLQFLSSSSHYRADRLFSSLPSEDMFEARAILLGRLGKHEGALEIYVYRLQDYLKAEEYCKSVYDPGTETNGIFLTLLRIYLRPTTKPQTDLLRPALELISRHSPRLDALETLQILPPLVTAQNVRTFLCEALRGPKLDIHVVREISKARNEQVARRLMSLQTNRVKVTDSRICPQCHKRLSHSVIAVHAPRGEVTHYQCREAFSRKLNDTVRP